MRGVGSPLMVKKPEEGGTDVARSEVRQEHPPVVVGRKSVLMGMAASVGIVVAGARDAAGADAVKAIAPKPSPYVLKWAPATAYAVGDQIISPNNDVVSANVAHTSSAQYVTDAAKWTLSSTYAPSVVVPLPSGDTTGVTDLAAIAAALAAVPATGGTVTLRPGTYYINAGLTIRNRTHLIGAGGGGRAFHLTLINYVATSGTALTVAAHGTCLEKFTIEYTASADPANAYGISVTSGDWNRYTDVTASTFNICWQIQGNEWHMTRCTAYNPKLYGITIAHTDSVDQGDQTITDSVIMCRDWNATAGIYWTSGGGLKIVNTKWNTDWRDPAANVKDRRWQYAFFG